MGVNSLAKVFTNYNCIGIPISLLLKDTQLWLLKNPLNMFHKWIFNLLLYNIQGNPTLLLFTIYKILAIDNPINGALKLIHALYVIASVNCWLVPVVIAFKLQQFHYCVGGIIHVGHWIYRYGEVTVSAKLAKPK